MKRFKRFIIVVSTVGSLTTANNAHAGIPVIDVASILQAVMDYITTGEQLVEIKNNYDQAKQTYEALNGVRGLGTILNDANDQNARRYLPEEYALVTALSNGESVGGYGSLQSLVGNLKRTVTTIAPDTFAEGTDARVVYDHTINTLATQKAIGQNAYGSAAGRTGNIENLIATIGSATDPKAIAEIQARIAAEQALVENENTRLQAMNYMQQVEQQEARQRSAEVIGKWGTSTLPDFSF